MALAAAPSLSPLRAQPTGSKAQRERISINDDWRFTQDDPPGNTVSLIYEFRPEGQDWQEGPADAEPTAAKQPQAATQPVLKPWILPTGNRFVKDPARRHVRPVGRWGGDVPYVKLEFDDRSWRRSTCRTTGPSKGHS